MLTLTPGQAGDNPQLQLLLIRHTNNGARGFRLLADNAYSHDSTRAYLRENRIAHTIPERSDQIVRRKAKGSHGGRPPGFAARRDTDTATPSPLQPPQTLARHRHPLRQIRPDIPRRSNPCRSHYLPPRPQLTDTP